MLVVCEGTVTEKQYLDGLKDHLRAIPVEVVDYECVGKGRDPHSTVELAIRLRDKAHRQARAQRDAFLAYDAVWCVVDVDDHATLGSALSLARRKGVNLVVSHPCFEVWLLLHFQELSAGTTRPEVVRKLQDHIKGCNKNIPVNFPFERHDLARQRALRADPEHCEVNRIGGNPSTNVWLLVDAMKRSGKAGDRR